jgi:hypothetical protein
MLRLYIKHHHYKTARAEDPRLPEQNQILKKKPTIKNKKAPVLQGL